MLSMLSVAELHGSCLAAWTSSLCSMLSRECGVQLKTARAEQAQLREQLSSSYHRAASARALKGASAAADQAAAAVQDEVACRGLTQRCRKVEEQLATARGAHQASHHWAGRHSKQLPHA